MYIIKVTYTGLSKSLVMIVKLLMGKYKVSTVLYDVLNTHDKILRSVNVLKVHTYKLACTDVHIVCPVILAWN